jgi:hypothetical protein
MQPIAGKPAPTGIAHGLKRMRSGWGPQRGPGQLAVALRFSTSHERPYRNTMASKATACADSE